MWRNVLIDVLDDVFFIEKHLPEAHKTILKEVGRIRETLIDYSVIELKCESAKNQVVYMQTVNSLYQNLVRTFCSEKVVKRIDDWIAVKDITNLHKIEDKFGDLMEYASCYLVRADQNIILMGLFAEFYNTNSVFVEIWEEDFENIKMREEKYHTKFCSTLVQADEQDFTTVYMMFVGLSFVNHIDTVGSRSRASSPRSHASMTRPQCYVSIQFISVSHQASNDDIVSQAEQAFVVPLLDELEVHICYLCQDVARRIQRCEECQRLVCVECCRPLPISHCQECQFEKFLSYQVERIIYAARHLEPVQSPVYETPQEAPPWQFEPQQQRTYVPPNAQFQRYLPPTLPHGNASENIHPGLQGNVNHGMPNENHGMPNEHLAPQGVR